MSKLAPAFLVLSAATARAATELATAGMDSITGLGGKLHSSEAVYRISQPRTDCRITVNHWPFGINTAARHGHMIGEQPRTFFQHCWGREPATGIAEAVKRALASTTK